MCNGQRLVYYTRCGLGFDLLWSLYVSFYVTCLVCCCDLMLFWFYVVSFVVLKCILLVFLPSEIMLCNSVCDMSLSVSFSLFWWHFCRLGWGSPERVAVAAHTPGHWFGIVMKEGTLHCRKGLAHLCPWRMAGTMFNANSWPVPCIAVLLLTLSARILFLACLPGQAVCLFPM
jgi:hypothetical protein